MNHSVFTPRVKKNLNHIFEIHNQKIISEEKRTERRKKVVLKSKVLLIYISTQIVIDAMVGVKIYALSSAMLSFFTKKYVVTTTHYTLFKKAVKSKDSKQHQ